MDTLPFANLPFEYARAMYSSFLASKNASNEATDKAKKELDEARLLVEKREQAYNEFLSSCQRYSEMLEDLTTRFPALLENSPNTIPSLPTEPYAEPKVEIVPALHLTLHNAIDLSKSSRTKRLHYPVKLTDKLLELLAACGIVQTDEEMTARLQKALDMPVPFKTTQNKLWELGKGGATKRIRAGASFINGMPEWFEGYRVKPQHAPLKAENKTAPALAGAE
jgi:hypothetical protein